MSSVDAILPKLLIHEQGFKAPKDEGGGGSDSAVAYVAQRKGSKEKSHGKDESRGKGPKLVLQMRRVWSYCPEVQQAG